MSKRYSVVRSFKDASVMKKSKLSLERKKKIKERKKKENKCVDDMLVKKSTLIKC